MDYQPEYNFTTPLAISCCVICPWFFVLYFLNRRVYPILQREPIITLAANVSFWLATQIWLFELRHYEIPCIMDIIAVHILVGITMVLFLLKVWKIYMDAGLTNELERDKHGWFVAHRSWRARRSLNKMAAVMISGHCLMFLIAAILDRDAILSPGVSCSAVISSMIIGGLAVIYLVVFLIASCKLAKVRDNYFIKSELRMVGLGSGLTALGWLAKVAADLPCALAECGTMLLWFCWLACFLASTIYPLTKAMFDRKFLWWWDLCRRGMLRRVHIHVCWGTQTDSDVSFADSTVSSRTDQSMMDESEHALRKPVIERNPMRALSSHLNPKDPLLVKLKQVPLKRLLSFNQGKEAFRRFTVMEFSVENMLFMDAVDKFRTLPDPTVKDVQDLYDRYISNTAPSQVNLPIKCVRNMNNLLPTLEGIQIRMFFDDALDHVMKLMQRDSYRRFQDTAEFAALAMEIQGLRLSDAPPKEVTEKDSMTVEMTPSTPSSLNHTLVPHTPHSVFSNLTPEASSTSRLSNARPLEIKISAPENKTSTVETKSTDEKPVDVVEIPTIEQRRASALIDKPSSITETPRTSTTEKPRTATITERPQAAVAELPTTDVPSESAKPVVLEEPVVQLAVAEMPAETLAEPLPESSPHNPENDGYQLL